MPNPSHIHITGTLGGTIYWNSCLIYGIIPGMLALALGGFTFILIVMCMAELTSTIPLSGGTYGFVRMAVGRQLAVVAAVMETLT